MSSGRKSYLENVVPMKGDAEADARVVERHREQASEKAEKLKPKGLPRDVGLVWDRMAPAACHPTKNRVHDELTAFAFAMVCYAVAKFHRYEKELMREGDFYEIEGRNGTQRKKHPAVSEAAIWHQKAWSGMLDFGMTPVSARKVLEEPDQGDLFNDEDADFA